MLKDLWNRYHDTDVDKSIKARAILDRQRQHINTLSKAEIMELERQSGSKI